MTEKEKENALKYIVSKMLSDKEIQNTVTSIIEKEFQNYDKPAYQMVKKAMIKKVEKGTEVGIIFGANIGIENGIGIGIKEGKRIQEIICCIKNVVNLFNRNYKLKHILKLIVGSEDLLKSIYDICKNPNETNIKHFAEIHNISEEISKIFESINTNRNNKKRLRENNKIKNGKNGNKKRRIQYNTIK